MDMNIFTLIIAVTCVVNMICLNLVELITSIVDYKADGLNYNKTIESHKHKKRTVFVNLITFAFTTSLYSLTIYNLFIFLL